MMRIVARGRSRNRAPRVAVIAAAVALLATAPRPVVAQTPPTVSFASPDVTSGYDFVATAVGDFDGDGLRDVAGVTSGIPGDATQNQLLVLGQQPDGSLAAPVDVPLAIGSGEWDLTLAAGRLNGDDRRDLAVGTSDGVHLLYQGARGLVERAFVPFAYGANEVFARHMLGGGRTDLVVSSPSGLYVLVNRGARRWRTDRIWGEGSKIATVAVGDLTGDGKNDVAFYEPFHVPNLRVLAWRRGGTYQVAGRYEPVDDRRLPGGLAVGDANGDGVDDLVLTIADNRPKACVNVFAGKANGRLAAPVKIPTDDIPEAIRVSDVDANGRKDVVLLHGGYGKAGVLLQQDDGSLAAEALFDIPNVSHYGRQGLAVADVSGDGAADLVIASQYLVILRQT